MPRRWVSRMKASIGTLCHFVNTHRMVSQYTREYYLVAHARARKLEAENAGGAREASRLDGARAEGMAPRPGGGNRRRSERRLPGRNQDPHRARLELGGLSRRMSRSSSNWGRVNASGEISDGSSAVMKPTGRDQRGRHLFETEAIACARSGLHGYTVRVLPLIPIWPRPSCRGSSPGPTVRRGGSAGGQVAATVTSGLRPDFLRGIRRIR